MVSVDPQFNILVKEDNVKTRIRIYFIDDSVDCTNDNDVEANGTLLVYDVSDSDSNKRISQDGITLTEYFNREDDIEIGDTVSSTIGISFNNVDGGLDSFDFGRCKIFLDAYDPDSEIWYPCSLGVFIIEKPIRRKVQLIDVVAYDQMQLLDKIADDWFNGIAWNEGITLYGIIQDMASTLSLSVSSTTQSSMVNDDLSFTEQPFYPTEMTYREILAWIAGASGTIARFDRNGSLDLAWFSSTAYSVNADTLGNTCLRIDPSEYSVAVIDKLQVMGTESDIGVIIGTGTNAYKILNNGFLYGQDETEITNKANPIYARLNGFAAYTPISTTLIADWSICSGDIISITWDNTTYSIPIFQQKITWRGAYAKTELFSSGNPNRTELTAQNRSEYRAGRKVHTLENTVDSLSSVISDMQGNISELTQTINNVIARVQDAENNIGQLEVTATGISSSVSSLENSVTMIQTDTQALWEFASTAHVDDNGTTVNLSKYIRFNDGDIVLGVSDSDMKLRLENDQVIFFTGEDFDANTTIHARFAPEEFWDAVVKALQNLYIGDDASTNNFKQSKTTYNGVGEYTLSRV